jgi:hypothetical protein
VSSDPFPGAAQCIREGRADALTVLGLAALRNLSVMLLAVGATTAILTRGIDDNLASQFDTPAEIWDALFTPLAGLALAVALRIIVAVLSFLSAIRLVPMSDNPKIIRRYSDQVRRISAIMSLRGTWAAREAAVQHAGRWGVLLHRAATVLVLLAVVGFVAMLVTTLVVGD